MIYLFVLALIWAIITLFGHATWVAIAALFRALFGSDQPPRQSGHVEQDDTAATHRMISRLASAKLITPQQAKSLRHKVEELESRHWRQANRSTAAQSPEPAAPTSSPDRAESRPTVQPVRDETDTPTLDEFLAPVPSQPVPSQPVPSQPVAQPQRIVTPPTTSKPNEPIAAPGVSSATPGRATHPAPASAAQAVQQHEPTAPVAVPTSARVSAGRSLAEFLAEHNIRWGELIAGLLIVVCSIGLVVSLWKTLTEQHRVVPSLIFLAGNTAIFGAGLYTLFRWRLQDTSRAALVIATLLVPLGILAGLSTGGIDQSTVMLNDPITVLAILGAGAVYLTLLWHSSRALVGSSLALPLTLGVAGPAAVLPLVPAALRSWGESAGFLTYAGSLAVAASVALMHRGRGRLRSRLAPRRMLVIGVSAFSLATLAGYLAFMLRGNEIGWLAIAVSTLPGMIVLAATASSFSPDARRPKLALAGNVIGALGVFAGTAMMIPMMESLGWLWAWAISFSIAILASALVFRSSLYTAITTLPLGLACVLSSPAVAGGVVWEEIPVRQMLVGGEPMLAAMLAGLVALIPVALIRDPDHRKASSIAAALWMAYGTANALLLTIAPVGWMGEVPSWVLSGLLASVSIMIVVISFLRSPDVKPSWIAAVGSAVTCAFWMSLLKPFVLGEDFPGVEPATRTLLATALCGLVFAEILNRKRALATAFRMLSSGFVLGGACLSVVLVFVGSETDTIHQWNVVQAIAGVAFSILAWLWIGFTERDSSNLAFARGFLVVIAAIIGHRYFHDSMFTLEAWRSGLAAWSWSALGWSVIAAICMNEFLLRIPHRPANPDGAGSFLARFSWYSPDDVTWDRESKNLLLLLSTAATCVVSAVSFGSLVLSVGADYDFEIYRGVLLPALLLTVGVITLFVPGLHGSGTNSRWPILGRIQLASVFAWIGWQVATAAVEAPSRQLVVATSLAAASCFLIDLIRRESSESETGVRSAESFEGSLLTAIGLAIVAISSGSLLASGWLPSIRVDAAPDRFVTLSVAAWWTAGAITSGWLGCRYRWGTLTSVATLLVTSTVILVSPLLLPGQWWIWIQLAAIANGILAVATKLATRHPKLAASQTAMQAATDLSAVICVSIGVLSSFALTVGVLRQEASVMQLHNLAGIALSVISATLIVFWDKLNGRLQETLVANWPIVLTLTSAHASILIGGLTFVAEPSNRVLPVIWIGVAIIAIFESCRRVLSHSVDSRFDRYHAAVLLLVATGLNLLSGSNVQDHAIGLIACVAGGVLATSRAMIAHWSNAAGTSLPARSVVLTRATCWYMIGAGVVFIGRFATANSATEAMLWTSLIAWIGSWAITWRVFCPDTERHQRPEPRLRALLADGEASLLVLAALTLECMVLLGVSSAGQLVDGSSLGGLFWIRVGFGLALSVTLCFRHSRRGIIESSIALILVSTCLLGVRIGAYRNLEPEMLIAIVCLLGSTAFAFLVFTSGGICQLINKIDETWTTWVQRAPNPGVITTPKFARAMTRVGVIPGIVIIGLNGMLLVFHNTNRIVPVAICGVALLAISVAELAERTAYKFLRHVAMLVAIVAVAMWASFDIDAFAMPMLALTTRWFVAWVILAAALGFAAPKLLGPTLLERWSSAIRSGWITAVMLAAISLVATFVQEAMVRLAGQTDLLHKPLYLGMAGTLGLLSLLCTLGGILSGPGFSYRNIWKLSDRQRVALIVSAQVFGGLTWFHLFLCKSPLANLGLRAYWPYVVMALSFASVGITEWARRRGDAILTTTLKQTALFLPLIPVIGFWLSGSWVTAMFGESEAGGWTYIQGRVSYEVVLVAAALYYGVISFLWKSGRARVVSILIGNAALWVILIQTPNWDFLSHPQAWLIPPAVCVLVATHLHRESLGTTNAAGIRYASTLVIYLASTADMLIQGIGSTIWGPIILITLALIGAGAGVAFRVRPFLYLGTSFVFIGVVSMVWHAQRQIDAVWPWWAFGITTGVLLLVGLMAIEKNKPKLRSMAMSLQQWDA